MTGMLALSLSGCFSDETSIRGICENNPQICDDIKTKGWCKSERTNLIRNRQRQITAPKDQQNLYNSLINWKEFSHCIEAASNIKRRSIEDRDPTKAASFVNSIREIEKLERQTANSQLPQLLYYHWAQSGDDVKIDRLIKLDKNNKLNTTELQLMMSSYYSKFNKFKAANAQYNALALLTQDDFEQLDHSIFASLSTYHYQQKNLKLSYIWAQVAVKFGLKANLYSSLTTELKRSGVKLPNLEQKAEEIFLSIESLTFIPPKK
jgi:hypothetical protein